MAYRKNAPMNRRSFLKGAVLCGGAATLGGLAGCSQAAEPANVKAEANQAEGTPAQNEEPQARVESWMPQTWDAEADVVVVGMGAAGGASAISAYESGASVIILEKSAEADGGNTGCSSGGVHSAPFADREEWIEKMHQGAFGTVDPEVMDAMVDAALATPDWMEEIGLDMDWKDYDASKIARMPDHYKTGYIAGEEGTEGRFLWKALYQLIQNRSINVRLGTPAHSLVQNPVTKEIIGVRATDKSGKELVVKANKGVILACGGYEGSPWKQGQYNQPGVYLYPWGTPNNTGDGIDMACEVGAALWHLHGLEFASVGFKLPSQEAGCSVSSNATNGITPYNHIFVNQFGKRFMNEAKNMSHDIESKAAMNFDSRANDYANLPFYLIFDSTMFDEQPLYIGTGRSGIVNTYAGVHGLCDWGDNNEKALEKGWIFRGDTLAELAANIKGTTPAGVEVGCDGEALQATVDAYNGFVADGIDAEFGRDAKLMAPLDNPPFYAIELSFSCINTQGGAQRNGKCEVVSVKGEPIPRLYCAGEFGSLNGYVYTFGNLFECFTTGRVAGENAASLAPWE